MPHDCTFLYPTLADVPAAARNVKDKLLGTGDVDNACAAHCAWVLQGYVQSVLLPHDHPDDGDHPHPEYGSAVGGEKCDTKEKAAACCGAIANKAEGTVGADADASGFDWLSLVEFLLPLVIQWLRK